MLIVCPNCATSYRVVAETLGEAGRSVRCVNCHHVWFEEPRLPEPDAPAFSTASDAPGLNSPGFASAGWGEPDIGGQPPIRPPLDDVVDVGSNAYSQSDSGEASELDDSRFSEEARDALHSDTSTLDTMPPGEQRGTDAEGNVERIAAQRGAHRAKRARRPLFTPATFMPALICSLVLTLGGLVVFRQQVVRHLPQTASLYALLGMPVNLRGLQFDNIKTARETQDGVPVLVVEGDIVGSGARLTEVPRLRFAVLDRAGKEIYAWTARPERTLLPPGETLPFRSRLASPPAEANSVSVRFFNRHDAKAGFM